MFEGIGLALQYDLAGFGMRLGIGDSVDAFRHCLAVLTGFFIEDLLGEPETTKGDSKGLAVVADDSSGPVPRITGAASSPWPVCLEQMGRVG